MSCIMSSLYYESVWSGEIALDETHLEEVRKIFLQNFVVEQMNFEVEQNARMSEFERITAIKKCFQWISANNYFQKFQKAPELSTFLRERGNEFYKKGKFQEALRGYNLAIAFGRFQESELGLAYGNRAAVFMTLKKPVLALRDIVLALENKYPLELYKKLCERRSKCEDMNKSNKTSLVNSTTTATSTADCAKSKRDESLISLFQKQFFSLKSPSSNVTHGEDFVQIDYNEKCGRRLVVKKEVSPGTVLLVENPYVIILEKELVWDTDHCHHCYVRLLGGIPCKFCTFATYCDEDCQAKGTNNHHKYEHNLLAYLHCHKMQGKELLAVRIITTVGPEELYKIFQSNIHQQKDNPIFSQLRGTKENAIYGSAYPEIYSLISHPEYLDLREKVSNAFKALILTNLLNESSDFFKVKLEYQEENFLDFVASLFLRHLENIPYNSFSFSELRTQAEFLDSKSIQLLQSQNSVSYATGLLPTVSLVNHSCSPNAIHVKNPKFCKTAFVTVKHLSPGDEVFISYGPHFLLNTRLERRTKLDENYKFICQCEACVENWSTTTLSLEALMLANKCPLSICTTKSKSLCRLCLENLRNLNERFEQYENQLHQAHDYVKSETPSDAVKAFEILNHCLEHFREFPPTFNLSQIAQDLFKRTLLSFAQAEDL